MKKYLHSLLIFFVLSLTAVALCITSLAADKCGDSATYEADKETSTVTISGSGALGNRLSSGMGKYDRIIINEGITEVGGFENCKMTAVTLPDSVTVIRDSAFQDCKNLTTIYIPTNVTYIGSKAFSGCEKLTSIIFAPNSKLIEIGDEAFYEKDYHRGVPITSVVFPASLTTIGQKAFQNCKELSSVTFESGSKLKTVHAGAFRGCENLTSIAFPEGFKELGLYKSNGSSDGVFEACTKLSSVTVPSTLKLIDDKAFKDCTSLKTIELPTNLKEIGSFAFEGSAIQSIIIPASTETLQNSTFKNCKDLRSVTISGVMDMIEKSVFENCSSLQGFAIPASVVEIRESAFIGCTALKSITIPSSVTKIAKNAFHYCDNLTVKCEVGSYAEKYCGTSKINFTTYETAKPEKNNIIMTISSTEAYVFGNKATNDVAPLIINGSTMLPARFVAENLGATVGWDGGERKITLTKDKKTITLYVDKNTAYVNGVKYTLDCPPIILNDRTYTPVRFIAENLGATVGWFADARQAVLTVK